MYSRFIVREHLNCFWSSWKKYKVHIIALQEIRWNGEGILEKQDHTILYSCEERLHFLGSGFVVKKKVRHLIIGFKADSSRICTLRIKDKFFNSAIINSHARNEVSEEEGKDDFYDLLEKTYEESPSHDVKIVTGDLNAQVGREEPYQPTIGKYSLHELTNDNGHYAALENNTASCSSPGRSTTTSYSCSRAAAAATRHAAALENNTASCSSPGRCMHQRGGDHWHSVC